ncbi:MAG TPA: oxidoreductase-like domain-containing protein [Luteimonas sp.]|nr:oxidoreductase-like domain-containing protein [Luteimonas sp.]
MTRHAANATPRPQPPERPLPADCCDGGCDPCIFDLHAEALDDYARRLAAWHAAQPIDAAGAHPPHADADP